MTPLAGTRRGNEYAQRLADYLNDQLAHLHLGIERRVLHGTKDQGDLSGIPGWVVEAKTTKGLDLAGALNEARREAAHAGVERYVAIHNRRSHQLERSYATVELWLFTELLELWLRQNAWGPPAIRRRLDAAGSPAETGDPWEDAELPF